MKILTAPIYEDLPKNKRKLFLAGGISGCENWQNLIIPKFNNSDIIILNPRREGTLNRKDALKSTEQITWEYFYLREATEILFWFPSSSICPITLFELGGALERDCHIYVGCDPDYDRIVDLQIQINCSARNIELVYSLNDLVRQVLA